MECTPTRVIEVIVTEKMRFASLKLAPKSNDSVKQTTFMDVSPLIDGLVVDQYQYQYQQLY